MTWCWHRWPKWSEPQEEPLFERFVDDPKQETRVVGIVAYQRRRCDKCNAIEIRKVKAR